MNSIEICVTLLFVRYFFNYVHWSYNSVTVVHDCVWKLKNIQCRIKSRLVLFNIASLCPRSDRYLVINSDRTWPAEGSFPLAKPSTQENLTQSSIPLSFLFTQTFHSCCLHFKNYLFRANCFLAFCALIFPLSFTWNKPDLQSWTNTWDKL